MIPGLKINIDMINIPIWAKAMFAAVIAFFMPIVPAMILVGIFILADTVTGIWAAVKRGEEITSRKMSSIITKAFLYQGALLLAYGLDVVLLGGSGIFIAVEYIMSKLLMLAIIFIEVKSIDENIVKISGTSLLKSVKDVFTRAVKVKNDLGQ